MAPADGKADVSQIFFEHTLKFWRISPPRVTTLHLDQEYNLSSFDMELLEARVAAQN